MELIFFSPHTWAESMGSSENIYKQIMYDHEMQMKSYFYL